MTDRIKSMAARWTVAVPVLAVVLLALTWGRSLPGVVVGVVTLVLAGAVLAAVHHAEVVAHRVGEPFGSLVLAVAVTVIEVALIVTLMLDGGDKSATLARDTVFAAVMITCNGIVGLSLLVGSLRHKTAVFNSEGTGAALATVTTLATLSLVLPTFTTSKPGPEFSTVQLTFAAVASLSLYGLFVATQTVRHRDYFLPVAKQGEPSRPEEEHAEAPSTRTALISTGLLLLALIGVVGLAKGVSPTIESGVEAAGLGHGVVGVIIALLVLLPETIAAGRAARRNHVQHRPERGHGRLGATRAGPGAMWRHRPAAWAAVPERRGCRPRGLPVRRHVLSRPRPGIQRGPPGAGPGRPVPVQHLGPARDARLRSRAPGRAGAGLSGLPATVLPDGSARLCRPRCRGR
ncbi:hypothetical protein SALBM217S_01346 [Streptomyces griseoloalbus]